MRAQKPNQNDSTLLVKLFPSTSLGRVGQTPHLKKYESPKTKPAERFEALDLIIFFSMHEPSAPRTTLESPEPPHIHTFIHYLYVCCTYFVPVYDRARTFSRQRVVSFVHPSVFHSADVLKLLNQHSSKTPFHPFFFFMFALFAGFSCTCRMYSSVAKPLSFLTKRLRRESSG